MSTGKGGDIGGDILFELDEFCDFELKLDWKISEGGNSGILYHAIEGQGYHAAYETAPEYQLMAEWRENCRIRCLDRGMESKSQRR